MSKLGDLIARLVLIGVVALCFVGAAYCQNATHSHTDYGEWEDNIGVKIVEITSIDTDLVYWKQTTKNVVKLSSFGYDNKTIFPKGFKPEGCHILHYCKLHLLIYTITPCKEK